MINHHPTEDILVEYVSGSLPIAQSIAIKAHLHYCTKCQHSVKKMESLAGSMLNNLTPTPLSDIDNSYDKLMASIDNKSSSTPTQLMDNNSATLNTTNSKSSLLETYQLPKVVSTLVDEQTCFWKKTNKTLETAPLKVGQSEYEVSLQRIKAGAKVPKHNHRGLEITLVLEGSFSDKQGIYQQGDFLIKEAGDIHQPVSARNSDCLCLSVQEAPVKLTGIFSRLLNPFIKIHAA